jgi:cell division GTPase FtsZ
MENRKDFGMLDEADVKLVVEENQAPAWTGSCDELPPAELFNRVKKVLLVITAGPDLSAEELNKTLDAVRVTIPDDALFLYTVVDDKTQNSTSRKSIELYVKRD